MQNRLIGTRVIAIISPERRDRPAEAEQVIFNGPLGLEIQLRNGEERTVQVGETDAGASTSWSSSPLGVKEKFAW